MPEEHPLRRRASSSPPASLRHFERIPFSSHTRELITCTTRGLRNPRHPTSLLTSLMRSMARMELVTHNCPVAVSANKEVDTTAGPAVDSTETTQKPQCDASAPPSRVEDSMRAELDAAKTQIQLLNKVNEQVLSQYNALEADNHRLQEVCDRLMEENESLKQKLAHRDEEIDEQFHLICKLRQDVNGTQ